MRLLLVENEKGWRRRSGIKTPILLLAAKGELDDKVVRLHNNIIILQEDSLG